MQKGWVAIFKPKCPEKILDWSESQSQWTFKISIYVCLDDIF